MAVRGQAERVKAPRALYCEFPLGRPLGRPRDPAYQHQVLAAAFALLATPAEQVPLLVEYPETIIEQGNEALVCSVPPRFDPQLPSAVDEALGLRPAYQRAFSQTGCTAFGKTLTLDTIPQAVHGFLALAAGTTVEEARLPGDPASCAADLRAYYEEAALALSDHIPAARQAEAWFFTKTDVGKLLLKAQCVLRQAGAPQPVWFYLAPMTRKEGVV